MLVGGQQPIAHCLRASDQCPTALTSSAPPSACSASGSSCTPAERATAPAPHPVVALATRRVEELSARRAAVTAAIEKLAAARPAGGHPDEILAMLEAVPDLRDRLRRGDPRLLAGIYEDFKVTATYEKATRQLTLEATVDAALATDAEAKRPPGTLVGRPAPYVCAPSVARRVIVAAARLLTERGRARRARLFRASGRSGRGACRSCGGRGRAVGRSRGWRGLRRRGERSGVPAP